MVGSKCQPHLLSTALVLLIVYLASVSVYLLGDVIDVSIDKFNIPNRPLASGYASRKDALYIIAFFGFTALALSVLLNFETFLITKTSLIIGYLYSLPSVCLKKHFAIKTIITASGGMLATLTGGAGVGRLDSLVLFAGMSYLLYMAGVTTITDLRDMEGDRAYGIRTIPLVLGPSKTIKIASFEIGFVGAFTLLLYSQVGFSAMTLAFTTPVLIFSVTSVCSLIQLWEDRDLCVKVKRKLVFLFIIYQVGLMAGAASLNLMTMISSFIFATTLIFLRMLKNSK